jgi:protein SCO1/2
MSTSPSFSTTHADSATGARRFFLGAGLPIFLLAGAGLYEAVIAALVLAPAEWGWLGEFAREFKVRCFNYDPRTGGMEWSAVFLMLVEPLFVVAVAALLWRRVLSSQRWLSAWRSALAGLGVAAVAVGSVLAFGGAGADADVLPPFPGERIRTRLAAPAFSLVDQNGQPCSLADLRGRVVVVTGIYGTCGTSCPQILIETRKLLDSLPVATRSRVSVVALSLNPEYDTSELMLAVSSGYGFTHPEFRYLNGAPAVMHPLLERLQFARVKHPVTGVIEHANLFQVIDPEGLIAYRFNLNPRHQAWLRAALVSLAAEPRGLESQ